MAAKKENPGYVKSQVVGCYSFLIDEVYLGDDMWSLGLGSWSKVGVCQKIPQLIPLFREGEPHIIPIPYRETIPPTGNGLPIGFEVVIANLSTIDPKIQLAEGKTTKYTLFHEGTGTLGVSQSRFTRPNFLECLLEDIAVVEAERPILGADLNGLRSAMRHINDIYRLGASYKSDVIDRYLS